MEQLPSEVVSSTFSHLSTIELGLTMSVCKGWKEVLLNTSTLWRHIDLPTPKHTVKIIEVFAKRSRNTLVSIKSPTEFPNEEAARVCALLELSKRTIRAIDLRLDSFDSDVLPMIWVGTEGSSEDFNKGYEDVIYVFYDDVVHYFQSFPKLERLNLTGFQLPEFEFDVLGDLVAFGTEARRGNAVGRRRTSSGSPN